MGTCSSSRLAADLRVTVFTGDSIRESNLNGNIMMVFKDCVGELSTDYHLPKKCTNEFHSGKKGTFYVTIPSGLPRLKKITKMVMWRDDKNEGTRWYVNCVVVKNLNTGEESSFPMFRHILPNVRYSVTENDTWLPQHDPDSSQRSLYLQQNRQKYVLDTKFPDGPVLAANIPDDEKFSWAHKWDLNARAANIYSQTKLKNLLLTHWEGLDEYGDIYSKISFPEPMGAKAWRGDLHFARQRTHGCNTALIRKCNEIPEKLGVTPDMVYDSMENLSIKEAIATSRLFIVDLEILNGIKTKECCHICAPVMLMFETKEKKLAPIAIQLEQSPGPDNPVFLPTDPEYTWLMAKMWYNHADAQYHQCCTLLAFNHLVMEGVWVSAVRQLSQSHPIYKLLAPHFLHIIPISQQVLTEMLAKNGWADKIMSCGAQGMCELIAKGSKTWRLNVEGTLPNLMSHRQLVNGVLTDFPYRDDATLLYNVIFVYVQKIVQLYYVLPSHIADDKELQAWGHELALPKDKHGVGLQGVPGNGTFTQHDQIASLATSLIFICTGGHAGANFPQYNEYAYPPNYPLLLAGQPPKDKEPLSESDIMSALPNKVTTLDTMVFMKVLGERNFHPLGKFDVDYVFDSTAKEIVKEFKRDLAQVSRTIVERNRKRNPKYDVLNPNEVPNYISI